jgi:hypothetical protein
MADLADLFRLGWLLMRIRWRRRRIRRHDRYLAEFERRRLAKRRDYLESE